MSPPAANGYFITGIGTGVGKTLITAAMAAQLRQAGQPVQALKPVISGYEAGDPYSDTAILAHSAGVSEHERVSPWRFAAPLSPHLAAAKEDREVDDQALIEWCQARCETDTTTLIEGVGGLMVPLNECYMVIDWIKALNLPVIMVGASYLGAINHTLLSLEALRQRRISVRAVLVSQSAPAEDAGLEDTCHSIRLFTAAPVIPVPRVAEALSAWKELPNLLSLIADGF